MQSQHHGSLVCSDPTLGPSQGAGHVQRVNPEMPHERAEPGNQTSDCGRENHGNVLNRSQTSPVKLANFFDRGKRKVGAFRCV